MTSKQRAYLKSLANSLEPIFQVGKSCIDDPKEIAAVVAERTHSQVVQVIGKKIILYKPDKKNPKIMLDKI